MTLPPQALLIRRMEGLVFSVLGELRARADWAALGAEYFADAAALDAARRAGRRVLGRPPPAGPRRLTVEFFASAGEFEAWLEAHADEADEVLVRMAKKHPASRR